MDGPALSSTHSLDVEEPQRRTVHQHVERTLSVQDLALAAFGPNVWVES